MEKKKGMFTILKETFMKTFLKIRTGQGSISEIVNQEINESRENINSNKLKGGNQENVIEKEEERKERENSTDKTTI